jgi:D-alanyl-D-alanine dipeptidase
MSETIYEKRCRQAQAVMTEQGLDYLCIGPGADLRYLTGTPGMENERMMMLIIPQDGQPAMIVPALEKLATSKHATYFELLDWRDGVGPQGRLIEVLGVSAQQEIKVGVGAHLWSMFLLELQKVLSRAEWVTATETLNKLRIKKSAEEIKLLKEAAAIADRTFAEILKLKFAGRSELQIMMDIQSLILKNGQEHMDFCIVASGPNGAQPHHHTGDRIIQPGDAIVLDFGGTYKGYCSDMTRMVLVEGAPSDPLYTEVYNIVHESNAAGHRQSRPGVTCESVDTAARQVIADNGYGEFFVHRTGHGIGMETHEEPYIVAGNSTILEPGMAYSIEPGIYLPGRFGVRIEDITIVTEDGEENINLSTKEIVTVR